VIGLSWIAESFYVDAEQFGALAVPAIGGLSAFLALFPALACATAKGIGSTGWRLLLAFAVCWSAFEWLRGHVLTGFPWNLIGYAWGVTDETLQAVSLFGIYGLGFLTIIVTAMPGLALGSSIARPGVWRWAPFAISLFGVLALWGFGALRLAGPTTADVPGVRLRVVQASIAQTIKWDPGESARILDRYLTLSTSPAPDQPTHIIWPETAVPYFIAEDAGVRNVMAAVVPPGGTLVTGAMRRTADVQASPALLNSLVAINASGDIIAAYDKIRLVPFGEYTPLRQILPLQKMTEGSIDYIPGDARTTLAIPGAPPAGPMICYEAIFPGEAWSGGQPQWLLNLTNDAWFGTSSGPYQHFLAARVRAIEEGLPLVRAANTGISAVTDAYGRIKQSLPLHTVGVIDAALPAALDGRTIYASLGDAPHALAMLLSIAFILIGRRPQPV
tara:strand:- start:704 stop:2038 length:1335 start_codon:yes stop_codon:yes gene_type:complete